MSLKRYILIILVALFAFSPELTVTVSASHNPQYKSTKKKTSRPKKSKKHTKKSKGKSKSTQNKKKRINFPFALIKSDSNNLPESPFNFKYFC